MRMKAQGHELMPLAKKRNLQVIKQEQINKMSTSSLFLSFSPCFQRALNSANHKIFRNRKNNLGSLNAYCQRIKNDSLEN